MADVCDFLGDGNRSVQLAFAQQLRERCEDGEFDLRLENVVRIDVLGNTVAESVVV